MKFTIELANRLRDECFNDEERRLLSNVEGSTYIDVSDQLMFYYDGYTIIGSVNGFIKNFATLKFSEGRPIIKQLELLFEKLDDLVNPELNFDKEGESTSNDRVSSGERSDEKTTKESLGTFTYNFTESSIDNKIATLLRGANTNTSQENKGIEGKWRKDSLIKLGTGQLVGKKEFDPNKVLQEDKILDVKEAHYEIIPEEGPEIEAVGDELYSTITTSVSGEQGKEYIASNDERLALIRDDKNDKITGENYAVDNSTIIVNKTKKNINEANLKSIRLQIPNLQSRFFNIFYTLFKLDV